MYRLPTATAVILAALTAAAVDAPPAPQESFAGAVEVTVVNVEVYVRDRKGRPVVDLGADDFRLLQDGVEVPISNFAVFSGAGGTVGEGAREPATAPVAAAPAVAARRPVSVVLYVDNVNLRPVDRNRALERVRSFVSETLAPPVEMMVVSSRPSLAVRQPFTGDVAAVHAALDRVAGEASGRLARDRDRREILDWMEEVDGDPLRDVQQYRDLPQNIAIPTQVQLMIASYVEQESDILEDSLYSLHEVVRLAGSRDGRGIVIHVSNGLPLTPGVDLMHEYEAVFQDSTIYSRIAQRTFTDEYRRLVEAANARGVSIYALDASGLQAPEGFDVSDRYAPAARASGVRQRDLQDSLGAIADGTGGLAVLNTNDLGRGLGRIRDDLASYYSVGYTVTAGDEDRTHRIEVELPGHPKLDVRHREWYVEKSPTTLLRERVLTTLVRDVADNPMGLELAVESAGGSGGGRRELPLKVSIPLANLVLATEGRERVARLELVVGLRDGRGREAAPRALTHELRIPAAEIAPGTGQRVAIVLPLRVRGGIQHTVAVGVRDLGDGRSSFARLLVAGS